ncbi:MAG: 50S ribosomal protein L24 [Bacteroidales bacterium]|nr:50S ribosomal protein L24 [Bacteroidales bacterium]
MQKKLHIKKGDIVIVNSGNDKGKKGRVLKINRDKFRAIVEGANIISKHTKPNAKYPEGGIIKEEAAIHMSNLNVVCPETGKATRIGRKLKDNNKLVRYSKKSKNQQEIK